MHWYFLQEMHFLVLLITVHEMPCIVIPSFLITVHEMPCIVIPSFLITVHEMPCIVIPRLLILLLLLLIILFTELLRLIQLEPLNEETLFELCHVGLVKDTCYVFFTFLNFILFKMLKKKNYYKCSH